MRRRTLKNKPKFIYLKRGDYYYIKKRKNFLWWTYYVYEKHDVLVGLADSVSEPRPFDTKDDAKKYTEKYLINKPKLKQEISGYWVDLN